MNLAHIGTLVHQRRQTLGLSQGRLAKLSGLSRATINQLEAGTIKDLGATKLIALLDLLRLDLQATEQRPPRNALTLISRTASVSYKHEMTSGEFVSALLNGKIPPGMVAHVATLLDEAPLPLIIGAVEEIAATHGRQAKTLWKQIIQWAHQLHSPRSAWS